MTDETSSPDPRPSIFPLPLSSFEQFTLRDDRRDYPMTFFFHWLVTGRVDRDAFEQSLADGLRRHPLLNCRIETRGREQVWVLSDDEPPTLKIVQPDAPLWAPREDYIDLSQETGLRVWVRQGNDAEEIVYQFHHACCDGIGAIQFLVDVAVAYAGRTSEEFQPKFVSLDNQRLLTRHHVLNRRNVLHRPTQIQRLRGRFREFVKFLRVKPVPLRTVASESNSSISKLGHAGEPNTRAFSFDPQTTQKLRAAARKSGATLNDLLVRDLLVTLSRWNEEHQDESAPPGKSKQSTRRRQDFRILVPTSLRAKGDQYLPAANVLGYAFITRQQQELANVDSLLIGVRNDTQAILRYKLGWMFLDTIAAGQRLQKILPARKKAVRETCLATAILSHLGRVAKNFDSRLRIEGTKIHVGNLTIDEIRCTPPVRPSTHAALASYTFAKRLFINVRCDPNKFSADHTQQFLSRYVERLMETANSFSSEI